MSLYTMFSTDEETEKEGIFVEYDTTRFKVARAGGSNPEYRRVLGAKTKKYRRQIENNLLKDSLATKLLAEAYAETIILGWWTNTGTEAEPVWAAYIEDRTGTKLTFTEENCIRVLLELPELFVDLQTMANQAANFRKEGLEADVKN